MKPIATKVYITQIDSSRSEDFWQALYAQASPERQAKTDRLRFAKDKRLCLAADQLLRRALAENGISRYKVLEDAGGKPYLEASPFYFNLSHSGSYALCAVSTAPVGCDIEKIDIPDQRLAQRFFCPEETRWIHAARDEMEQATRFYRLWTLKESYIKAIGRGLTQPLNSFCFHFTEQGPSLPEAPQWFFKELDLPGYRCAVCAQGGQISQLITLSL